MLNALFDPFVLTLLLIFAETLRKKYQKPFLSIIVLYLYHF